MLPTIDWFEMGMANYLENLIQRKFLTVFQDTPIERVLSNLSSKGIGALVVKNNHCAVVGSISERDIIHRLAERKSLDGLVVNDIMARNVISIEPNISSFEIIWNIIGKIIVTIGTC